MREGPFENVGEGRSDLLWADGAALFCGGVDESALVPLWRVAACRCPELSMVSPDSRNCLTLHIGFTTLQQDRSISLLWAFFARPRAKCRACTPYRS